MENGQVQVFKMDPDQPVSEGVLVRWLDDRVI